MVDLQTKNKAMLNKWIWRYSREEGSLWRRIVDAKIGEDEGNLMPLVLNGRMVSPVWREITQPFSSTNPLFVQVHSNFGFSLGNGENIRF